MARQWLPAPPLETRPTDRYREQRHDDRLESAARSYSHPYGPDRSFLIPYDILAYSLTCRCRRCRIPLPVWTPKDFFRIRFRFSRALPIFLQRSITWPVWLHLSWRIAASFSCLKTSRRSGVSQWRTRVNPGQVTPRRIRFIRSNCTPRRVPPAFCVPESAIWPPSHRTSSQAWASTPTNWPPR